MIAYFILGLALLVACVVLLRWFLGADPKAVIAALRWVLALLGIALVLPLNYRGILGVGPCVERIK